MGRVNSSISGLFLAATIELTADERKKLEALHREMVESEQSQTRAEHDWRDCKYQLVVDHLGNSATGGYSEDRKSTRLNSSHGYISYAVFCLKKKKKEKPRSSRRCIETGESHRHRILD